MSYNTYEFAKIAKSLITGSEGEVKIFSDKQSRMITPKRSALQETGQEVFQAETWVCIRQGWVLEKEEREVK